MELCNKNLVQLKNGKFVFCIDDENLKMFTVIKEEDMLQLNPKKYSIDDKEFLLHKKYYNKNKNFINQKHINCANLLSSVKYRINKKLLDYLLNCDDKTFAFLTGYTELDEKRYKLLVQEFNKILKKTKTFAKDIDVEIFKKKDALLLQIKEYEKLSALNNKILTTLLQATTYINSTFHYNIYFDSRGRIYYRNSYLSPQTYSLGKNLIEFAECEKAKDLSVFYNLGYDYYKGRKFINNHGVVRTLNDSLVSELVKNINFTSDLVYDSKKPLDYINWYLNYELVKNKKKNEEVEMNYIVKFDATCSGTQHISMLLKDTSLARSVNVLNDTEYGFDYYSTFADFVNKAIHKKRVGIGIDKFRIIGVYRDIVKKSVMSYAYNARSISMYEDIKSFFKKTENGYIDEKSGVFLTKIEMHAYCKIIVSQIKKFSGPMTNFLTFFNLWAEILSYFGLGIVWVLPQIHDEDDSINFNMKYLEHKIEYISLYNFGKKTKYSIKKLTDKVNANKQKDTYAPNLIHSLDAYHVLTFCDSFSEGFMRYTNVAVIHDCFGVSVKDSVRIKMELFLAYKRMYQKTDILKGIYDTLIDTLKEHLGKNPDIGMIGYDCEKTQYYIIIRNYENNQLKYLENDPSYEGLGIKK